MLDKPSGLLSVPGKDPSRWDCLRDRAISEFPEALLVHRLDMDTSGIFLMAMSKDVQGNLGKQFERRKVQKTYIALAAGLAAEDEGLIDLPLRCDWDNRPLQMVCHEHGRPSQTHWKVLERDEAANTTRFELKPITGRSHQLRVHLKALGHPILGDSFYAPGDVLALSPRLCLHAHTLTIHHPEGGELVSFESDVPF